MFIILSTVKISIKKKQNKTKTKTKKTKTQKKRYQLKTRTNVQSFWIQNLQHQIWKLSIIKYAKEGVKAISDLLFAEI